MIGTCGKDVDEDGDTGGAAATAGVVDAGGADGVAANDVVDANMPMESILARILEMVGGKVVGVAAGGDSTYECASEDVVLVVLPMLVETA